MLVAVAVAVAAAIVFLSTVNHVPESCLQPVFGCLGAFFCASERPDNLQLVAVFAGTWSCKPGTRTCYPIVYVANIMPGNTVGKTYDLPTFSESVNNILFPGTTSYLRTCSDFFSIVATYRQPSTFCQPTVLTWQVYLKVLFAVHPRYHNSCLVFFTTTWYPRSLL